jgi:hypothetical protein
MKEVKLVTECQFCQQTLGHVADLRALSIPETVELGSPVALSRLPEGEAGGVGRALCLRVAAAAGKCLPGSAQPRYHEGAFHPARMIASVGRDGPPRAACFLT